MDAKTTFKYNKPIYNWTIHGLESDKFVLVRHIDSVGQALFSGMLVKSFKLTI